MSSLKGKRPLRVLQLRDSPWVDGPGRTILETASHLDPAQIEYHVGVFAPEQVQSHPLVEALQARGSSVFKLRDRGGLDSALIADILRLVDELRIDVIHSSEFRSNVLALMCRRRRPINLIATTHGWIANDFRGRLYRMLDKALLRRFDGVIFVSHAMRRLTPRWWIPARRACVLHNALVLESYGVAVAAAPRRAVDPEGVVTLLNVGRLSPEKAQNLIIEAVAALTPEYPGLRLKFAGVGPQEQSLRRLASARGIDKHVEFLGYVKDMPSLYADVDLLVQSSLTEGLPNVILEAAYLRVPIIATAVGGTAEVVQHDRSAWLIRPGSATEIERGVRRFLERPQDFQQMAETGRRTVQTEFSFQERTRRLTDFYHLICASSSG